MLHGRVQLDFHLLAVAPGQGTPQLLHHPGLLLDHELDGVDFVGVEPPLRLVVGR